MARVLRNWFYDRKKDEYRVSEQDVVYADQKVAILETEEEIGRPLVLLINNETVIIDRDSYEVNHKKFCLTQNEYGKAVESPNGDEYWLPKDTDVSKLRFINGQLVMVDDEPKEKPKKETNKKQGKEG